MHHPKKKYYALYSEDNHIWAEPQPPAGQYTYYEKKVRQKKGTVIMNWTPIKLATNWDMCWYLMGQKKECVQKFIQFYRNIQAEDYAVLYRRGIRYEWRRYITF